MAQMPKTVGLHPLHKKHGETNSQTKMCLSLPCFYSFFCPNTKRTNRVPSVHFYLPLISLRIRNIHSELGNTFLFNSWSIYLIGLFTGLCIQFNPTTLMAPQMPSTPPLSTCFAQTHHLSFTSANHNPKGHNPKHHTVFPHV